MNILAIYFGIGIFLAIIELYSIFFKKEVYDNEIIQIFKKQASYNPFLYIIVFSLLAIFWLPLLIYAFVEIKNR